MPPGQRRMLHLAERTNARHTPTGQGYGQTPRSILGRGHTHGGYAAADTICAFQRLG